MNYSDKYLYCLKVKLATLVEGRGVGEGTTPFSELVYFTFDTYLILLSVKQRGIKYHF